MTRAEAQALLPGAPAEPISPEYDPVWAEACDLLGRSSAQVEHDPEATRRTVRALRFDHQSRQALSWVPVVLTLLASAAAFLALAEAVASRSATRPERSPSRLGSYLDSPDVRR